jgi:hypothetical protein
VSIIDMNRDGLPEIIAMAGDDRIREIRVFEWGSTQFSLLNTTGPGDCSTLLGPESWPFALDANSDGQLELVLKQGIPIWSEYSDGLPWRTETRTCSWNGAAFVLTETELTSPPQFRFQAVQDGDRASLAGDYASALDSYQQVIFNDKLEPWSLNRYFYEAAIVAPGEGGTRTPIAIPAADPAEYPTLAAYARYRMMLVYVVRSELADARTTYDTLQAQAPSGRAGHAEAELASAFWNNFQTTGSVAQACASAIDYTAQHPADVLAYLGTSEYSETPFGSQSLEYVPASVCPFH